MTHYERGRSAEWELRDYLTEQRGMYCTRSAGSHAIDIWAVDDDGVLGLYECKSTKDKVYYPSRTKKETEQMVSFVNRVKTYGGKVYGFYAVRFGGGVWRFFPIEELDGRPLRCQK